jgi:hypothetical protein
MKSNLIADANIDITSKASGPKDPSKCMVEWIYQKSEPFVCSARKPFISKNHLKKIKYVRTKTLMACVEHGRTLSRKVNSDAFLFKATKASETTK